MMSLLTSRNLLLILLLWIVLVTIKYLFLTGRIDTHTHATAFRGFPYIFSSPSGNHLPSHPPFSQSVPNDHFRYVVTRECNMSTCFRYTPCFLDERGKQFRVYVYPDHDDRVQHTSSSLYSKILYALRSSQYYTDDPSKACIFIPSMDSLDRDPLSPNYQAISAQHVQQLSYWRKHGENHLIFNLYAGTWPDYHEHELGFPVERAILVKASFSAANMRSGYDISLPLFHPQHPLQESLSVYNSSFWHDEWTRPFLLSFKGKRYVRGIGSISRNALFHLHNDKDVIMLTTCRHGDDWQQWADDRCEMDNANYDKLDYEQLMRNSTFCLVPRGRRLGSYRFLESLKYQCIPVVLSNDWELPFSDIIDWPQAIVWADESALFQVSDKLRDISEWQISQYRRNGHQIWMKYFSSVERIVNTVLEIMKERVSLTNILPGLWTELANQLPNYRNDFSHFPCDYPLKNTFCQGLPNEGFDLVIHIAMEDNIDRLLLSSNSVMKYIEATCIMDLCSSNLVSQIFIIHGSGCSTNNMESSTSPKLFISLCDSSTPVFLFCPQLNHWIANLKSPLTWIVWSGSDDFSGITRSAQILKSYKIWKDDPQQIIRIIHERVKKETMNNPRESCESSIWSLLSHRYFVQEIFSTNSFSNDAGPDCWNGSMNLASLDRTSSLVKFTDIL